MADPRFFENAAAFRQWLEANHASATELIVGYYKVGSGLPSMTWPESVDEALCFGWIDGVRGRIDDVSYHIRFTPRRPKSIWSAVNIAKFEKLRARGKITSAGLAAWERRTEDKSEVYAYEQQRTVSLTREQLRAFKRKKDAWQYFENTPPGYRKVILHWVTSAKKPETRARRFDKLVEACAQGIRIR